MADTMTLTIQLSPDAREFVRKRVESGEFGTESDVVSQSVERMMTDDEDDADLFKEHSEVDFQAWLVEVAGPVCDRMQKDPSRGVPIADVPRLLEERRRMGKRSA